MNEILDTPEIENLSTIIEEATRSTEEGVKRFVEPARGTLRRAKSRQHQIVFGRRGSGKSSLLRKAVDELSKNKHQNVYIDLEVFKSHSYPDVLISVLIESLTEFENVLLKSASDTKNKGSFLQKIRRMFCGTSTNSSQVIRLINDENQKLKKLLHSADEIELEKITKHSEGKVNENEVRAGIKADIVSMGSKLSEAETVSATEEVREAFQQNKIDFLHRNIREYRDIFHQIFELTNSDSYIFFDDLYHIRRDYQAYVIDYFHRIAKGNNLWIKVGTIRHRTQWYIHGNPPIGVKIGDDADEIDLDSTLEKYSLTKAFLVKILNNFLNDCGEVSIKQILSDGAIDRLIIASGGVARDFLGIFRKSIDVARDRESNHRGQKIGAEDVNFAAGEYESSKKEEFKRDTPEDRTNLENEFNNIRDFCISHSKANLFLLDKDENMDGIELINELVDLRLIHKVKSRVTISARPGKIFEAYMLDVSQYSGTRKRRDVKMIEFWRPSSIEQLRRVSMIYNPSVLEIND